LAHPRAGSRQGWPACTYTYSSSTCSSSSSSSSSNVIEIGCLQKLDSIALRVGNLHKKPNLFLRLPARGRHDPWMVAALLEIWNAGRRLGRQHCPTLKMVWHAAARRGVSLSRRGFHVAVGVASLSAPKKAWKGDPGEDHFFVSPSGEEGSASLSFGVADGVSQVKPADYSRELCEELQRLREQQGCGTQTDCADPSELY
jgi:hypothetical protein